MVQIINFPCWQGVNPHDSNHSWPLIPTNSAHLFDSMYMWLETLAACEQNSHPCWFHVMYPDYSFLDDLSNLHQAGLRTVRTRGISSQQHQHKTANTVKPFCMSTIENKRCIVVV